MYRMLGMRRPIWLLGSIMDSGCDVYFTKDRCWIAKNNGKELDVIPSGGAIFVATKPSKLLSRKKSALELNSMSQAEVERATSTRVHAGFGVPDPAARDTLDGDESSVRIRIPTGPVTSSAVERKLYVKLRDTRSLADGVDGVLQREQRIEPHLREAAARNRGSRVKN